MKTVLELDWKEWSFGWSLFVSQQASRRSRPAMIMEFEDGTKEIVGNYFTMNGDKWDCADSWYDDAKYHAKSLVRYAFINI